MDSLPLVFFLDLGLVGIVLLCFGEKFLPVMPSYVLLVLFGLTTVHSTVDLVGAVTASTLGSVLGAIGWYSLGRMIGHERSEQFIERFGKYVLLRPAFYRRLMAAYSRNQFLVTAIGQTVPTARIYLPLPAGAIGLSFVPFVLATTLGTLTWNAPLVTIGYLLRGSGRSPTANDLSVAASTIGVACLAIFVAALTHRLRLQRRSS
jgi:membrane protein DedA with SNARE-associated domain